MTGVWLNALHVHPLPALPAGDDPAFLLFCAARPVGKSRCPKGICCKWDSPGREPDESSSEEQVDFADRVREVLQVWVGCPGYLGPLAG